MNSRLSLILVENTEKRTTMSNSTTYGEKKHNEDQETEDVFINVVHMDFFQTPVDKLDRWHYNRLTLSHELLHMNETTF